MLRASSFSFLSFTKFALSLFSFFYRLGEFASSIEHTPAQLKNNNNNNKNKNGENEIRASFFYLFYFLFINLKNDLFDFKVIFIFI
jgi:hypothetical protein